ncbi:hypothetical protein V4D30_00700 [Thermodesulfovibrio sp. 3907-1M]|uniref:PARP catalytic domain-containing protein n=1 Tax=Thermodesulfovibrio autotrophicus TaxID=3118333 RepID=A0AAU8GWL5_9BACT
MSDKELKELKQSVDELKELVKAIYNHLVPNQTVSNAKVYQLKERARRKALEIKQKLDVE